jgi:hypothetical protein
MTAENSPKIQVYAALMKNEPKNEYVIECLRYWGHAVASLVEALCYKPEDHGCHSRWGH